MFTLITYFAWVFFVFEVTSEYRIFLLNILMV